MDSPPLLWSLLDAGGGRARWCEVRLVGHDERPAGPTARTTLRRGGARVECWDGLVGDDRGVALVRLVRAAEGDLQIVHELEVGGFDRPRGGWTGGAGGRAETTIEGTTVRVEGGEPVVAEGGRRLRTTLRAERGRWAALVIAVDTALEADPTALARALGDADEEAGRRLASARLPRHQPQRAADALAVLSACTFRPTGAVVAAPTTSLPEAPGADRQFDYRYCWVRDASLAVSVAALLGQRHAAEAYLRFLREIVGDDGRTPPLVDIRGGAAPPEREVPGVAGWAGSLPVRVGNDAAGQLQYDALGLAIEGVSVHVQTGGRLDDPTWAMVGAIADRVAGDEVGPSHGIWELRRPRPLLSADIGAWLAVDRAVWIARGWRPWTRRRRWIRARDRLRARVLAALTPEGGLPQSYDDDPPRADGASFMAVVFGMLGRRDPRATRLVDRTLHELEAGAFVHRYEPDASDDFSGAEGAFVPVSWWAVAALAAIGRVDEAAQRADAMWARLPRLVPEEVDPGTGEGLGNVPLVWSHMEGARASYILDAARRRERYGSAGLWAWRLARYASLRWGRDRG